MAMAKQAASVMFTTMAGVPEEVRLEASILLFKSLVMAAIKPEHRLRLFNSVVQKLRTEIKEDLEKRKST
jgi:hypothetical protein